MVGFERIAVVGAGMVGSEVALMFALSGRSTLLSDQSRDAAERAIERLHGVLDRGLLRSFWSMEAAAAYNGRKAGRTWCRYDANGERL